MIVIKLENGLMKHWKLMKIFVPNSYFTHYDFLRRFYLLFYVPSLLLTFSVVFVYYSTVIYATRNFRIIEQFSFVTFSARKWVAFPLYSEKPGGKSTKVSLLLFQLPSVIKKTFWIVNITVLLKNPFAVRRKTLKKNFTFEVLFLVTSSWIL